MKYLGIDYGSKRIGLSVGDENTKMAFPREVCLNEGGRTLDYIKVFCQKENIEAIVLGESLNYKGESNPIQKDIIKFKNQLEEKTHLSVRLVPEVLTSREAERNTSKDKLDASAAAIILQSFLDRI